LESVQRIQEYPNFVLIQQLKETENPPNDKKSSQHDFLTWQYCSYTLQLTSLIPKLCSIAPVVLWLHFCNAEWHYEWKLHN